MASMYTPGIENRVEESGEGMRIGNRDENRMRTVAVLSMYMVHSIDVYT